MTYMTTWGTLVLSLVVLQASGAAIPSGPDEACVNGWCSWSTGDGVKQAYATMIVNGGTNALSDITGAAGWKVDGCPSEWKSGETKVTMTCTDESKCQHVFNGGAEDTLVRLPEECGKGPFARVMQCTKVSKRGESNSTTITKGMQWSATLSFDLGSKAPDPSKGPVMMYLTGSNVKGAANIMSKRWVQDLHVKRGYAEGELHRRGFFSKIGNAIKDGVTKAADKVGDAVKTAANDVKKGAEAAVSDVKQVGQAVATEVKQAAQAVASDVKKVANATVTEVKKVADEVKDKTSFNKTETEQIKPISVQKNFPIFSKNFQCGQISADISMNVDADLEANVGFGYTIIGSLLPPKLDDVNVQATLNGQVAATFHVDVGVQGFFDTGLITLVNIPLTPLEIPGVGSIGPVASVNAELSAQMDIEAQLAINTGFSLPNVNLIFPQDKGKSSGGQTAPLPPKQPLKVSVGDGTVNANGNMDLHLIPRLDFGIEVLKFAKATVFLELDASGTLSMSVNAARTVDAGASKVASIDPAPSTDPTAADPAADPASEDPSAVAPANSTDVATVKRAATNSVSGTVSLDGSLFMSGGLDGSLGSLFSKSINFPIFQVTKNIFTKNFGTPAARSLPESDSRELAIRTAIASRAAAAASAKKPGPAAKIKQSLQLNCFSSGTLLGGGGAGGFISSLLPIPL